MIVDLWSIKMDCTLAVLDAIEEHREFSFIV